MIPNKNKKKSLEGTVEEMRNFSFAYIEKYSPSKQQLKTYLLKKYTVPICSKNTFVPFLYLLYLFCIHCLFIYKAFALNCS